VAFIEKALALVLGYFLEAGEAAEVTYELT
jgi:hypothetical protein